MRSSKLAKSGCGTAEERFSSTCRLLLAAQRSAGSARLTLVCREAHVRVFEQVRAQDVGQRVIFLVKGEDGAVGRARVGRLEALLLALLEEEEGEPGAW